LKTLQDAYDLLHRATINLAQVEANGLCVDVPYIHAAIKKVDRKIEHFHKLLMDTPECTEWKAKYGPNMNIQSNDQLADMLYNELGYEPKLYTDSGKPATSEEALEILDGDFVEWLFKIKKYEKAKGTYLIGTLAEVQDGFVHPSFSLHNIRSYRSGCSNVNVQNITNRNKEISKLVRKMYIPRAPDRYIVEIDYSTMEVRIGCIYHQDPTMIKYMADPAHDMHKDSACDAFLLSPERVSKPLRGAAKVTNFSLFYGSYYPDAARTLWEACARENMTTADGQCIFEHLKSKGIKELGACNKVDAPAKGTFERHIQKFENKLWKERFPVYDQWRRDEYTKYQSQGYFQSFLGFKYEGHFKRNDVANWATQGTASCMMLWALCELQDYIKQNNMKSCIIAEIHDSIIADVPSNELIQYCQIAQECMVDRLIKQFPMINTPIVVEAEVAPMGESWADKSVWDIEKGDWIKDE